MTDALDASLTRLRRAVDDRQRKRRAPPDSVAEAPARAEAPVASQGPPPPRTEAIVPFRPEPEANQSWTDLLRRLLGR